ncbi:hypothetical protein GCM10010306_092540 [Streptomyces umbrinus]|nr:hypothetical protein GCM10010306_092540 [Streptomyces umbrinus]
MTAGTRGPAPGSRLFRSGGEASPRRWDFISENRAAFGVKRKCRALGLSRSGYYQHRATADAGTERAVEEERTVSEIRQIHADHQGAYGAPRVHAELRSRGRKINRKRVSRLMRINRTVGAPAPQEGHDHSGQDGPADAGPRDA